MFSLRGSFIRIIGNKKVKSELKKEEVKRILVPSGRIGDMVCETPFLKALHKEFPKAEIDVYLDEVVAPLFKNCPYINVILNKRNKNKWIKKIKALRIINSLYETWLIRKKYDLYFSFTNEMRFSSILGLKILSPKYIISSYRREKFGIKKDELTIYDKYIDKSQGEHMRDLCLSGIETIIGEIVKDRKYEVCLGSLEKKYENYFDKEKINIIFNYLRGSDNKNLSYIELKESCFKVLEIKENIIVHIMTLPNRYEELLDKVKKWNENRIMICPETKDILDAAALIKYSDIMISVDTGVVHIASAFNIPVISIFSNNENSIKYFSPISDLSYIIKCEDKHYIKDFDKNLMLEHVQNILKQKEKEFI
jgi:ADP-heptose:LPS heptosyltransferase